MISDLLQSSNSRANPEKIETIISAVSRELDNIENQLGYVKDAADSIKKSDAAIREVFSSNELVNARRVAVLDEDVRIDTLALLDADEFGILDAQLTSAQTSLDALRDYFEHSYKPTMERMRDA